MSGPGNEKATRILLKLKRVGMQFEYEMSMHGLVPSISRFQTTQNIVHSNYHSGHFDSSLLIRHTNVTYVSTGDN